MPWACTLDTPDVDPAVPPVTANCPSGSNTCQVMNLQTKLLSGHSGGKSRYRNPCGPPKKASHLPRAHCLLARWGYFLIPHPWSYFSLPTPLHVGQGLPHLVMRRETGVPHPSSSRAGLAMAGHRAPQLPLLQVPVYPAANLLP